MKPAIPVRINYQEKRTTCTTDMVQNPTTHIKTHSKNCSPPYFMPYFDAHGKVNFANKAVHAQLIVTISEV